MIRKMISQGEMDFTTLQLSGMTRLDWKLARRMCDKMVGDKMIINTTPNTRTAIFRFNIGQQILKDTTEKKRIDADPPRDNTSLVPTPELQEYVRAIGYDSDNERDQRIDKFLLKMIEKGIHQFTAQDYSKEYMKGKSSTTHDLRKAQNLGIIKQIPTNKGGNQCIYVLNMKMPEKIRTEELTNLQKSCLTILFTRLSLRSFTVEKAARILKTNRSSAGFHLTNFAERGILSIDKVPGGPLSYSFGITPKEHPECFQKRDDIQTIGKHPSLIPQSGKQIVAAI